MYLDRQSLRLEKLMEWLFAWYETMGPPRQPITVRVSPVTLREFHRDSPPMRWHLEAEDDRSIHVYESDLGHIRIARDSRLSDTDLVIEKAL